MKKLLEDMAFEAGLDLYELPSETAVERFAALVAERCAQLVTVGDASRHPVDYVIDIQRAILAEFPKP